MAKKTVSPSAFTAALRLAAVMNLLNSISSLVPFSEAWSNYFIFPQFHRAPQLAASQFSLARVPVILPLRVPHSDLGPVRSIVCSFMHKCMTPSFNGPITWNWISPWCRFHNIFSCFLIQDRLTVLLLERAGLVPTFVKSPRIWYNSLMKNIVLYRSEAH